MTEQVPEATTPETEGQDPRITTGETEALDEVHDADEQAGAEVETDENGEQKG